MILSAYINSVLLKICFTVCKPNCFSMLCGVSVVQKCLLWSAGLKRVTNH